MGGFENLAPVASFPGCEGFYPGLFDLEGNVAEWVDSCDGSSGPNDHCTLAGGSEIDQIAYCTETFTDMLRQVPLIHPVRWTVASSFGLRSS